MKKVYIVWDENEGEIVSVHESEYGARQALYEYLTNNPCYTPDEWQDFAETNGYDTTEEFLEEIQCHDGYDAELLMSIEEREVKE